MVKALIVDDNPNNVMVAEFILEDLQVDAHGCHSAMEALELIDKASFDFILLDWMMPDIDGIQFLGLLKQKSQHESIKVIICSAKTGSGDQQFALNSGAAAFLTKPITGESLETVLKELELL